MQKLLKIVCSFLAQTSHQWDVEKAKNAMLQLRRQLHLFHL
jgi:hypothetical protein